MVIYCELEMKSKTVFGDEGISKNDDANLVKAVYKRAAAGVSMYPNSQQQFSPETNLDKSIVSKSLHNGIHQGICFLCSVLSHWSYVQYSSTWR